MDSAKSKIRVCMQCRIAHKKCDGKRPCERCAMSGKTLECCDPKTQNGQDPHDPAPFSSMSPISATSPMLVEEVDFGQVSPTSTLFDNAQAVDVFGYLGRVIVEHMYNFPELFVPYYGKEFMFNFSENVLNLSEEEMSRIDAWNDARSAIDIHSPEFTESETPVMIYRSAPVYMYAHALMLSPRMAPILMVNRAFINTFGWDMTAIEEMGIRPQTLIHREDVVRLLRNMSAVCLSTPYGRTPAYDMQVRIMNTEGEFVLARLVSHVIRSPTMCPTYGICHFFPISPPGSASRFHTEPGMMGSYPSH
eukprot:TRINITY_DN45_c1_g1_i1.p1 TRINITY_DN45_c1_g1~~TRINITY_DN45_c1_g1_i1.p1  ORF type:complete len:306 (-),score=53.21 TRINITY_DN45_c1_g1_i1:11-928(-)